MDLEKIETRSKRVRDIMAEQPPFIVCHGTTILAILILVVAMAMWNIL